MYPPNLKKKRLYSIIPQYKENNTKKKRGLYTEHSFLFYHLFTKENLKHIPVRNLTRSFRQAVGADYLVPTDKEPRGQGDESGVVDNLENGDNFITITLFHFNDLLLPKVSIVYLSSSMIASLISSSTMITELRVLVLYSS